MSQVKNSFKTIAILFGISILAIGCEREKLVYNDPVPAPPQAIYSVTGDSRITLYWNGPYEGDITDYVVYRSYSPTSGYVAIGNRAAEYNPNLDLIVYQFIDNAVVNGTTYYYAIASVDEAGQMSELSAENVYDTPRPEGEVLLLDANIAPAYSGFSLSHDSVVSWSSVYADVWVDTLDGIFFLNKGRVGTDFQDMGYRDSLDGVSYAPDAGWANLDFMEIVDGHTYVIWTADAHYAKLHVETIASGHVIFTWAYQTDLDNPELAVPRDENTSSMSAGTLNTSKDAKREYLRSRQTTNVQSSIR
ncbi:MAG: hypothetical protein AAB305_05715 [Candidatus Zixiibacteriota bacterium]